MLSQSVNALYLYVQTLTSACDAVTSITAFTHSQQQEATATEWHERMEQADSEVSRLACHTPCLMCHCVYSLMLLILIAS